MFHVKRRFRCLKKRGFLRERSGDHLASERRQFFEQPLQIFIVQLRCWIVQKQHGAQVELLLEKP